MTDPIQTIRSLDTVSTGYTFFEKDQVLTEKQLNGITSYLDDQERMTRIELLGVGIVGGLRVKLVGNQVVIVKGAGITTDADLPVLAVDTTFDRYRNYDEKAPVYLPFYPQAKDSNPGPMLQVFELVSAGTTDDQAHDLSTLPVKLNGMVVVMYVENYKRNPNLCSGTDCDNLGQEITSTVRFLLLAYKDAASLLNAIDTDSSLSLQLPEIAANRPLMGKDITTVLALAARYCAVCQSTMAAINAALPSLYNKLPRLIDDLFDGDPSKDWIATINSQFGKAFTVDPKTNLLQSAAANYVCYYDFLKDLAESWNALRDVLLDDDSVLCPDSSAFPKHLLLGSLANPVDMRTGWYPSPLIGNGNGVREHARFLVWKLHTLINAFDLPNDNAIVVTPSMDESVPLEKRAIPYYYRFRNDFPIHLAWNYRLDMRGEANRNLGYRAAAYGGSTVALKPLSFQLGRYNFFRIEGHMGQNVGSVSASLNDIIAANNLPIAVRAVLLHNDRKKIVIRPPFRYTPLHGLHYLIRKDVATHLGDVKTFSLSFRDGIYKAASDNKIPLSLPWNATTDTTKNIAQFHYEKVDTAIGKASAPLGATRYSDYRKSLTAANNWKTAYTDTLNTASSFKLNFGDMVRNEFSTPLDSLMTSNHSLWLDWLDDLIDFNDASEDDKLLFSNFIAAHPGMEHAGGVVRGGTFILVYDDKANVVADFMLPYYAAETVEDEPDEPELTATPYKPVDVVQGGFTLLQPLDAKLIDFKEKQVKPEWQKEISLQKDHINFFTDTLQTFNSEFIKNISTISAGTRSIIDTTQKYSDGILNSMMEGIAGKQQEIEKYQTMFLLPDATEAERTSAKAMLDNAQAELAQATLKATQYIAQNSVDVSAGSDGSRALGAIATAMGNVSEPTAVSTLKEGLSGVTATGTQKIALESLVKFRGL